MVSVEAINDTALYPIWSGFLGVRCTLGGHVVESVCLKHATKFAYSFVSRCVVNFHGFCGKCLESLMAEISYLVVRLDVITEENEDGTDMLSKYITCMRISNGMGVRIRYEYTC